MQLSLNLIAGSASRSSLLNDDDAILRLLRWQTLCPLVTADQVNSLCLRLHKGTTVDRTDVLRKCVLSLMSLARLLHNEVETTATGERHFKEQERTEDADDDLSQWTVPLLTPWQLTPTTAVQLLTARLLALRSLVLTQRSGFSTAAIPSFESGVRPWLSASLPDLLLTLASEEWRLQIVASLLLSSLLAITAADCAALGTAVGGDTQWAKARLAEDRRPPTAAAPSPAQAAAAHQSDSESAAQSFLLSQLTTQQSSDDSAPALPLTIGEVQKVVDKLKALTLAAESPAAAASPASPPPSSAPSSTFRVDDSGSKQDLEDLKAELQSSRVPLGMERPNDYVPKAPSDGAGLQWTASLQVLYSAIFAAIRAGNPIVLQGLTAAGKTSTVLHLARVLDQPLVRFNMSSTVDVAALFGALTLHSVGKDGLAVDFVPGPFTFAYTMGAWLILDEVNLAKVEVLDAIEQTLQPPLRHHAAGGGGGEAGSHSEWGLCSSRQSPRLRPPPALPPLPHAEPRGPALPTPSAVRSLPLALPGLHRAGADQRGDDSHRYEQAQGAAGQREPGHCHVRPALGRDPPLH